MSATILNGSSLSITHSTNPINNGDVQPATKSSIGNDHVTSTSTINESAAPTTPTIPSTGSVGTICDTTMIDTLSSPSSDPKSWSLSGEERLEYMLSNGESLGECSVRGMSPLQYACSMFDEELALRILNTGVGVDWYEIGRDGYTALHLACEAGMNEVVTWLLNHASINDTIIMKSGSLSSLSPPLAANYMSVSQWLACGTSDIRITSSTFQAGGRTPLHIAAHRGEEDLINKLVTARANPFAIDWDNNTPLFMAAAANRSSVVKLLRDIMITSTSSTTDAKVGSTSPTPTCIYPWGSDDMPTREWVATKHRHDQERARWRGDRIMDPQPPLTSFHVLPRIWSVTECDTVWSAVMRAVNVRGWSDNRHRAYNTTDIPACDVPEIEPWVRRSIRHRVFPKLLQLYFGQSSSATTETKVTASGDTLAVPTPTPAAATKDAAPTSRVQLGFRDLFFVKYEAAGGQASLDVHRDGSLLSFNILLNPPTDFDGGGTYFEAAQRTITIAQGDMLCHSGQLLHGGHMITRGRRFILVGFIDVIGYHPGYIAQQHQHQQQQQTS